MNIHAISKEYLLAERKILAYRSKNNISKVLDRELEDLASQCGLCSESIIRDFTDEGIALENLLTILKKFNDIALKK
ncbi:hypothetical protein [Polaribacter cellanae]|uniref:Uncharacterized protein n=1 Tax=Polaribacter cellanae TaxID=2818493 RepID=A0A975CNS7_9FLAO|nr:hypothetical protein [Polaribacter cellanae]QTE21087.1 hypothetical protein J3359_09515 [Polaribacter cellanae]